jgi:hypothetical protein
VNFTEASLFGHCSFATLIASRLRIQHSCTCVRIPTLHAHNKTRNFTRSRKENIMPLLLFSLPPHPEFCHTYDVTIRLIFCRISPISTIQ